jgi:hypothetical protein
MFLRWRKPVISQKVNDEISELSEETIHTIWKNLSLAEWVRNSYYCKLILKVKKLIQIDIITEAIKTAIKSRENDIAL